MKRRFAQVRAFNLALLKRMHLSAGTPRNRKSRTAISVSRILRWYKSLRPGDNLNEPRTLDHAFYLPPVASSIITMSRSGK